MAMDVIDYDIFGDDMQYVEVELDPGEAAIGEAGVMMFMQDGIEMETIFGDGSAAQSGLLGKLMGAGKRLLTGESLFTTVQIANYLASSEMHHYQFPLRLTLHRERRSVKPRCHSVVDVGRRSYTGLPVRAHVRRVVGHYGRWQAICCGVF
jgi:hypothetical protein